MTLSSGEWWTAAAFGATAEFMWHHRAHVHDRMIRVMYRLDSWLGATSTTIDLAQGGPTRSVKQPRHVRVLEDDE